MWDEGKGEHIDITFDFCEERNMNTGIDIVGDISRVGWSFKQYSYIHLHFTRGLAEHFSLWSGV